MPKIKIVSNELTSYVQNYKLEIEYNWKKITFYYEVFKTPDDLDEWEIKLIKVESERNTDIEEHEDLFWGIIEKL